MSVAEKGLVVRAKLPSRNLLTKRFPELFKNSRVGNKNIQIVTGYFLNKLPRLSAKFYDKLGELAIKIPAGENRYIYVVPPQNIIAFWRFAKELMKEYELFEKQLRDFITKGKIPENVKKNAKFEREYIQLVQEYLISIGADPTIDIPSISDRVHIELEEFRIGDQLFEIFAKEKYEELMQNLSNEEKKLLREVEERVRKREEELLNSAYKSVENRVNEVVEQIEQTIKEPATRRRVQSLRAALEAAEELAASVGMKTDLSKPKALLMEVEESLKEERKRKRGRTTSSPSRRKMLSTAEALEEALAAFSSS